MPDETDNSGEMLQGLIRLLLILALPLGLAYPASGQGPEDSFRIFNDKEAYAHSLWLEVCSERITSTEWTEITNQYRLYDDRFKQMADLTEACILSFGTLTPFLCRDAINRTHKGMIPTIDAVTAYFERIGESKYQQCFSLWHFYLQSRIDVLAYLEIELESYIRQGND